MMTGVAVRAWTEPEGGWPPRRGQQASRRGRYVLVWDTETAGPEQRFLLLVWRLYVDGALITEGIAYPDALRGKRLAMLRAYVDHHQADTEPWANRHLVLITLSEWIDHHLHRYGYSNRATVVGANLPFDIGTIAAQDWTAGRSPGSFTFRLAPRYTSKGRRQKVWHRPDLSVRHLDNGAFVEWTGCVTGERDHADGRRWRRGEPLSGTTPYRGRFVDVLTLHFALTGRHAGLDTACRAWGVATGKVDCDFGVVDEPLVDHCRSDVAMTAELHGKLTAELRAHSGVELADSALWSPATVAARYLDAMRITPLLDRLKVAPEVHAAARCASYGARTEARIVRHPVPVAALDVASMYPTVSALLGTWRHWIARELVIEVVTDELTAALAAPTLADDLYESATWQRWGTTLVELVPAGDVLVHQVVDESDKARLVTAPLTFDGALWWTWPDVAAAVLVGGGKVPTITRAIRLAPKGRQRGLRPVKLRGGLDFDPRRDDLFPFLVSARQHALAEGEAGLARFYKIVANAASHGLTGRYDHKATLHRAIVHAPFGAAAQRVRVERPGPHAFPAISSTTTAGARLILAMAERAVADLGGCWAHCDTDSAKIVATPAGGLVACPGGGQRITPEADQGPALSITTPEPAGGPEGSTEAPERGLEAVLALSWDQVRIIARRFDSLRPEGSQRPFFTEEHDSLTRPTWALVTGPKSYALYRPGGDGIELVAWTETSLGESYLSPERGWSADAWRWIVERARHPEVRPESPAWWAELALQREAAVNPIMVRAAAPSGIAARPFGFRLAGTAWGGANSSPVAPYESNRSRWADLDWRDRRSGEALTPTPPTDDELALSGGLPGERLHIIFTTLGQVMLRVAGRAVPTFDDPVTGRSANHRSRGVLARRPTVAEHLVLTGADRTPMKAKGEADDQRHPTCRRCRKPLDGRSDQRWCSDACREAGRRQRAKKAAEPGSERTCAWSSCSTVLTSRQPTWCAGHRKRGTMQAIRKRAWLERLERIGGRPCSDESCRAELFGGARCSFHEKQAS